MTETEAVAVFVRNRGEIFFFGRNGEAGTDADGWGTIVGRIDADREASARRTLTERAGIAECETTLVRAGEPFSTAGTPFATATEVGSPLTIYPFLFDCVSRTHETNRETASHEWIPPTALLRRDTVPELWRAYDRVRPTVGTVSDDREHGSAALSRQALTVLRDEAALLGSRQESEFDSPAAVARALLGTRPSMTALTNRINRAMSEADATPRRVETAAHAGIERAIRVDSEAATNAANEIDGKRVATLSRSGTVIEALEAGEPESVLVAESSPGEEGIGVAERLSGTVPVTLTTDAEFAYQLAEWDAEVFLVGADSILADGRFVNKVGTRGATMAAKHEGIPVLVAAASDKISPDTSYELEPRDSSELYDGDADVAVVTDTFDVTPATCLDAVVTERGRIDVPTVRKIAAEHAQLSGWSGSVP